MYEFSPFRLDTANQCLLKRGPSEKEVRIQLPPKAFSILQYLVDNADRLVIHNELMDKVWPDTFVQPEVLASHIRDIRGRTRRQREETKVYRNTSPSWYRFIAKLGGSDMPAAQPSVDSRRQTIGGARLSFVKTRPTRLVQPMAL